MLLKDQKTNEMLKKRFDNNFELVNYAITLAENMLQTRREARLKLPIKNPAYVVLEEIAQGKDYLDEVIEYEPIEYEEKKIEEVKEPKPKKRKILKNLRTL